MNSRIALFVVSVVAILSRLLFLSHPNQVIFDEVHFGKFVTSYCCSHERFFDIHPPDSKLIIAASGYVLGYRGRFDFDHIGESYANVSAWTLRLVPALAGALLALVVYRILRLLDVSFTGALLGAAAIALDNAQIVQSRLIGLDSLLLLFEFSALLFALEAAKRGNSKRLVWWGAAGIASGLAIGTKFTGLSTFLMVGLVVCIDLFLSYKRRVPVSRLISETLWGAFVFFVSAFVVYIAGWYLHFYLLTQPGSGDVWGIPTGNFVQDVIKEHKSMLSANYNLKATHPYESKWWQWPIMARSVFYWSGSQGEWIYFLGNPIVWIGSTVLIFLASLSRIKNMRKTASDTKTSMRSYAYVLFAGGYLLSFIPLMRVPRALFLYHYLTPLIFAILLAAWWLDSEILRNSRRALVVCLACVVVGWLFILPVTYGIDAWQSTITNLVPSWR